MCLRALISFCSARGRHCGGEHLAWHTVTERQECFLERFVVLVERGIECHRHLDDLLPYPADARADTGGAPPEVVQHVYQRRHDAHRIRGALFHPRHLSHHHSGPGCTT